MTNFYSSDIDFNSLVQMVLQELREPTTGSEAVPLDLVEDMVNRVYSEAFNDQRQKQSARENNTSFIAVNDTTLDGDVSPGATSIVLNSSATYRTSGAVLLENEIVTYSGNNTGTNTLTGVSPVLLQHYSGEVVRQMYLLTSLSATIDCEQIQYLEVNGLPQTFMEYDNLIGAISFSPNTYTIYKGYLLLSQQSTQGQNDPTSSAFMVYTEKVTPLSGSTDKPVLIPNSFRVPILVYGACMKIAASDAFRTSWDWWTKQYETSLSQYIAFRNNRIKSVNTRKRPSVYTGSFNRYMY